ncbi:MAG TPA: 1-acyl-sn-glycerol-3-phosphate acyltransferase [Edaphocola sp.]|nr:1-acyl-sn-glycerol-3-phosphate acyltransferase [Edaphocola sp.]
MTKEKYIDIDKVFKEKNPKAYRLTPKFLINYIKKIVHEEDLNRFENENHEKFEFEYLDAALSEIGVTLTYSGLENVPIEGGCIVASNHPLGGIDGMALLQIVGKVRRDLRFLVNDMLTNLVNFKRLFVPVNKVGATSTENLKHIDEIYASDQVTMIFPAGLVSRKIDGKVQDLKWNKSFVRKAVQYKKPVIPVLVEGQLSPFFYRLSNFRKMIGVQANIEMIYLANEMYKLKNTTAHFIFGKPIQPETFDKRKKPEEWAELVREFVYQLKDYPELSFEDYLKNNNL